ncbi:MAG: fibronectin type III domain-containing protein [Saprospiraceae bacterium]|nr:fibronectin type III domain-containing protein [Saprospiraceae bacterium]
MDITNRCILIGIFTLFLTNFTIVTSQVCNKPFSISFSEKTTSSIKIKWSDTNDAHLGWEIELVLRGAPKTGISTSPLILTKEYTFNQLVPSTAYELYIRTICTADRKSDWNGPFLFSTVLTNPTDCQINLPIKDNGTEIFLIAVDESGILGQDVFIESVDMILEHDWPADLKIMLQTPSGHQAILSNHNGIITDDFGDISDQTCISVTSFNQNACAILKDNRPPYIGSFKPDENMADLGTNTNVMGEWKLIFFDRALKDVGKLKYFHINFNREKCTVPENFTISEIGKNNVTLDWDSFSGCNTIKIVITEPGQLPREIFVNCHEGDFTVNNLLPNTTYEISLHAICGTTVSELSCNLSFTTTCEENTIFENFDDLSSCIEGCGISCPLTSSVWTNVDNDGNQDWIVWQGKTDTENTGPSGDINGPGKYIYIENNPLLCGINNPVILQSKCIEVKSNLSGCDMSFYYHFFGADIASLKLEISTDAGNHWSELIKITGSQEDRWKRVTLSLSEYDQLTAIFRFTGISGDGSLADMALDQIEFYNSILSSGLSTYYADHDLDGYGTESNFIEICSSYLPSGFSRIGGDCDDNNSFIHPNANEIRCNSIDENCNGKDDDLAESNPILYTINKQNVSCIGSNDGLISLSISGGNPPYNVEWNTTENGSVITGLGAGIYYAFITDTDGCMVKTDFIQINTNNNLNAFVTGSDKPSCLGMSDGNIFIEHTTGLEPYLYIWSNGHTTKNLTDIPEGIYSVTITDSNNCMVFISGFELLARPAILTDVKTKRNPNCFGQNNGFIELITINGTPPYTYLWDNNETTATISNLYAGTYRATITDNLGCEKKLSTILTQPDSINIQVISSENVRCFGETNGSIKIKVIGGTTPYTYFWNNFSFTDDIFDLKAGEYTVSVTDSNGCLNTISPVTISQPALFEIFVDSIKPSKCILGQDGYIGLNSTGGTPGYNYVWNHTDLSNIFFDHLISGNYSVTAYDQMGCKSSIPNIYLPYINDNINIDLSILSENACYNDAVASISAQVLNGKSPYDFNWSNGIQYIKPEATDIISNLPAGDYQVTITDNQGCTGNSEIIRLEEKEAYFYTVDEVSSNDCRQDSSGFISIHITGGSKPIDVSWNDGQYSGQTIQNLPNGVYSATITDSKLCSIHAENIFITSESDLTIESEITHDVDNKSSGKICILPQGGILPYQISWTTGVVDTLCIRGLSQGIYSVTVTDGLGCDIIDFYNIENISETENIFAKPIKIFPNPVYDFLQIESEINLSKLILIPSFGSPIQVPLPLRTSGKYSLDIRYLPAGLYFLESIHEHGSFSSKFIKI